MTDTSKFHAYTDKTDTIIGTSLEEALAGYLPQYGDPEHVFNYADWKELDDGTDKTIVMDAEAPRSKRTRVTKTLREWIEWHIANDHDPDNFQRLLCSTEY